MNSGARSSGASARARFGEKATQLIAIRGDEGLERLDGDGSPECFVDASVHLAHGAFAQEGVDTVGAEPLAHVRVLHLKG